MQNKEIGEKGKFFIKRGTERRKQTEGNERYCLNNS